MVRDLTQFQWKKDFHKLVWEKIKEANPNMPQWTMEQLHHNGWSLRVGTRGHIELRHNDGSSRNFLLSVNGQIMPHITAIAWRIHGFGDDHRITQESVDLAYVKFKQLEPNATITKSVNGRNLYCNFRVRNANAHNLFKEIRDTPLDTSYVDPNITTAKKYVLDVVTQDPVFLADVNT